MKKLLILTILAITFAIPSQAQAPLKKAPKQKLPIEEKVKQRVDKLNAICTLSGDQATKVTALMTEVITKRQTARQANAKETPELKAALKEIEQYKKGKLKEILTPEQKEKLKAYHKSLKAGANEVEQDTKVE